MSGAYRKNFRSRKKETLLRINRVFLRSENTDLEERESKKKVF
jgi:hypothetical protein